MKRGYNLYQFFVFILFLSCMPIYTCKQEMFRKHISPLGAKFKSTTYMYKSLRIQNFVQGRTKHNQIRVKDYS